MILLDTMLVAEAMRPQAGARVTAWLDEQDMETLFLATVSLAALVGDAARLPVGAILEGGAVALGDAVPALFEGRVLASMRRRYGVMGRLCWRQNGLDARFRGPMGWWRRWRAVIGYRWRRWMWGRFLWWGAG